MKMRGCLAFLAILCVCIHIARAGDSDVNITCEKKRIEVKLPAGLQRTDVEKRSEQWAYTVSVANQTFKPLANLEARYIIFYKHAELGVKGPPRKMTKKGKFTIPSVESLGSTSFTTTSVTLTKAALVGSSDGGYSYFLNGAKPTAADSLAGIWIRIYQNGSQFAEYAYPADLKSMEKWQDDSGS